MAVFLNDNDGNYVETDRLPDFKYVINEEKSYCYQDNSKEHDNEIKLFTDAAGQHIISNLGKNNKCFLYFDRKLEINISNI